MNLALRAARPPAATVALVAAFHLLTAPACRRTGLEVDASTPIASASTDSPADARALPTPVGSCGVAGSRHPLLARWTSADREALSTAMRAGIAVVSADDCLGLRVLPRCHARGHYGFLGGIPDTYGVDLSTDEELRVNAPVAGATLTKGEGATHPIHVDVTIVGSLATVRGILEPRELTGECEGATHFVTDARLGAANVNPLNGSDAGRRASPCAAIRPTDAGPPADCSTVVSITIDPIAPLGNLQKFERAPDGTVTPIGTCPATMVVSKQRCVRPPVLDAPYLCAFGDAAGCQQQCDRGDVNSCDVLAFMLSFGKGVAKDKARAATLYAKSCEQADTIACSTLAAFEYNGEAGSKDPAKAVTLLDRACALGASQGCGNLGVAYVSGTGVSADVARGMVLFERACAAGDAQSCLRLVMRWRDADAGANGAARARAMLDELCDTNVGAACTELGRMSFLGQGAPNDHERAATLFDHACRAGDDEGCIMLGLQYRQGDGVARDDVRATRLMNEACTAGSAEGCLNLGIAYEAGKGVAADPVHAAHLYEQACTDGAPRACRFLGDQLREGVGIAKDEKRAAAMYARACQLGDQEACSPGR